MLSQKRHGFCKTIFDLAVGDVFKVAVCQVLIQLAKGNEELGLGVKLARCNKEVLLFKVSRASC